MDIRTWQEADRLGLPESEFWDEPEVHDAGFAAAYPDSPGSAFGDRGAGPAYTAADVIDLGPAEPSGARGGRSAYSARHRSGRSPFSPLRPAPIAIGSLSTAAIAAFAFVGPGILHGGDASSTMPVLDGMPHRIAPMVPGSSSPSSGTAGDQSSNGSAATPGAPNATGSPTSASSSGGRANANAPAAPGSTISHSTGAPSGPGQTSPTPPPSSDPSRPPTVPPPTGDPSPPAPPTLGPPSPPTTPPSTPPTTPPSTPPSTPVTPPKSPTVPVFDSSAAVSSALTEISAVRSAQGDQTLAVDPVLTKAASRHTADMAHTRNFSHTGSDGSTPYTRAQALGCWTLSKELIARGRPGDDVIGALLKNSQSRQALLSYWNSTIGVSAQQDPKTGDVYWTIELGWM